MTTRAPFRSGLPASARGQDGWGCLIATAIGLGLVAWVAGAVAATVLEWNEFVPLFLGLAVAVGVGAGPFLARAARRILGSKASVAGDVGGDLLLAGLALAALILGAWLAGRTEVTCLRDRPGVEARCVIHEYRWLGLVRAVDRTVPGVRAAGARGGDPAGVTSSGRRRTPGYALVLDTASGPVLVTDASRPSAEAAATTLASVLEGREPGTAVATIVDWLAPLYAAIPGLAFTVLPIRRAARRLRASRRAETGGRPT